MVSRLLADVRRDMQGKKVAVDALISREGQVAVMVACVEYNILVGFGLGHVWFLPVRPGSTYLLGLDLPNRKENHLHMLALCLRERMRTVRLISRRLVLGAIRSVRDA